MAKRQRGSALILALVVIVFAVIVGVGFAQSAATGKRHAAQERQLSQAYYAAESGLKEVLAKPDTYITSHMFPSDGPALTYYKSPDPILLPENPDLRFEIEVQEMRPGVYEIRSLGATPYATALAAAEVRMTPLSGDIYDSAFHIGGIGVPLTVPGTPGGGEGQPRDVNYHFFGADMSVYGTLQFEFEDEEIQQSEQTFNIWDDGKFLSWNHISDRPDGYPEDLWPTPAALWLEDTHDDLDENAIFPADVADLLYQSLTGAWPDADTTLLDGNNLNLIRVGIGDDPGNVRYIGNLSNNATIDGAGHLRLESTTPVRLKTLIVRGDLTIWVDSDISIESIEPPAWPSNSKYSSTEGHKLVIISEGSIKIDKSTSLFDPYPFHSSSNWEYVHFLGSGSVLWARDSLTIAGQVRAGLPSDYSAAELNPAQGNELTEAGSIIFWNPTHERVDENPRIGTPDRAIALVSRGRVDEGITGEYFLAAHTIDGAGIVYAGDRIKVFRTRLIGAAYIRDPYEIRKGGQGNKEDVVGMAELHLTAGDLGFLDDLGAESVLVRLIRRIR